ncbi:MAG: diadenylate cyclase [Desulfobacterales bacterium]|nr:diadenylate cyclase [Desulfobacterales bacterium]
MAVIALIVIFQPELRKMFERAVSVRRARTRDPGDVVSRLIAYTLFALAKKHQGALVVFPGREPIQEWVAGGYALDARPSIPLLRSIFDPNSPGHDGALIIEKGRFARLGVRLPISQSQQLSDDYGTRHHAAMGLAEKSDALTVLVSEERGQVSVFYRGQMRSIEEADDLVKAIIDHWRETSSYSFGVPRGRMRRVVVSQMLVSLALAVVLWSTLIIAQGEKLEKMLTVPVEFTASPPELTLVGDKAKEVRLHLSGSRSDLDLVDPANLSAKIDLSKATAGKQAFIITAENFRLPRGVALLDVAPASIELTLAELVEREIAIKPQLVGKLPSGHMLKSVDLQPSRVKVLAAPGTKELINVTTTPIYLENFESDDVIYCKIIAPPVLHPVDKRWPDVKVTITLDR